MIERLDTGRSSVLLQKAAEDAARRKQENAERHALRARGEPEKLQERFERVQLERPMR
jgi:hypothetical protein